MKRAARRQIRTVKAAQMKNINQNGMPVSNSKCGGNELSQVFRQTQKLPQEKPPVRQWSGCGLYRGTVLQSKASSPPPTETASRCLFHDASQNSVAPHIIATVEVATTPPHLAKTPGCLA